MRKIKKARKITAKELVLDLMIAMSITAGAAAYEPIYAQAATDSYESANVGDDLFVDDTDDAKTEDIQETDVIKDNVVEDENHQNEDPNKKDEEDKKDENKNDGGSCVTPEHNYNDGDGEFWDPSIPTEEEKKFPDTPDEPEPDEPEPDKPEPDKPEPDKPTPKTGDLEGKLLASMGALGLIGYGLYRGIEDSKKKKNVITRRR